MTRFQIRDEQFGLAIYEADSPRDALLDFFADLRRGEVRPLIEQSDDGKTATVTVDGATYTAVSG